jgi:hypothetical protein
VSLDSSDCGSNLILIIYLFIYGSFNDAFSVMIVERQMIHHTRLAHNELVKTWTEAVSTSFKINNLAYIWRDWAKSLNTAISVASCRTEAGGGVSGGHGGEPTDSIKRRELLNQLNNYRLPKKV